MVIDACCLLNLLATRREVEITRALEVSWLIPERAKSEVAYLRTPPDEEGERHREPVDFLPLEAAGLLTTRTLDESWLDAFVSCAAHLNDEDASCVALAATIGAPLVTDDPKERRVAGELYEGITLRSTLELLHDAANQLELDDAALVRIAFDLRWRGNFLPPRRDVLSQWYKGYLERALSPEAER